MKKIHIYTCTVSVFVDPKQNLRGYTITEHKTGQDIVFDFTQNDIGKERFINFQNFLHSLEGYPDLRLDIARPIATIELQGHYLRVENKAIILNGCDSATKWKKL